MEKRIGTVTILIVDRSKSAEINTIISDYSDLVLCRQGLPFHDRPVAVISLIVEASPTVSTPLPGSWDGWKV